MKAAGYILASPPRRHIWRAWCVALALALLASNALAAQPLTGTFKGRVIGRQVTFTNPTRGTVTDWAGVLNLQLDQLTPGDGKGPLVPVFCIEVDILVRGGDRYRSDGSVTTLHGGCQIRYLLDKYPASTAITADEAAARQLAIWHFSDDVDLATVQNTSIQARAIALANEATAAVALNGCPGMQATATSLTLNPPTATVVTGQPASYTVQVTPANAAQSIDIQINGTATFLNGQQQITLPLNQGLATFSVINAVAGTSTVTAILPYQLDAGTVFSPIDASQMTQRLVMAERVNLIAQATVQAIWAPPQTATPPVSTPASTPSTETPPVSTPASTPSTETPTVVSAPPPSDTATAQPTTPPTATPTRKPSSGPKPSPTSPPPGGSGGGPTATPGGPAPAPPETTPSGPQSSSPSDLTQTAGAESPGESRGPSLTPGAGSPSGSAGGAGVPRPSRLPTTGVAGGAIEFHRLLLAALLLTCGLWLRRHVPRR
jgi:hypothetical protein